MHGFQLAPLVLILLNTIVAAQPLTVVVPAGTPVEISIDKRFRVHRTGEAVTAHVVRPVFVQNQKSIPEGSLLRGRVVRLDPISKPARLRTVMSGDFTPLKIPQVTFDELVLPGGASVPLQTIPTSGKGVVVPQAELIRPPQATGLFGKTGALIQTAWLNGRQQLSSAWKAPDKWYKLQETGYSYLPYHPQYISARTALVVQLASDASLPTENYAPASNTEWALPANDTLLRARLTSQVSSKSKQGTQVEAVVSEPLYSADHKLEVPEGTRLIGSVQMSQAAQSWKRGGEVRIEFHTLRPPAGSPDEQKIYHVQAVLTAIDTPRIRNIAVDPEGSTRATEPFTRFLVPSLKLLVDTQFIDSDQQNGQSAATRTAWRTLAGASGYGVLGGAASQVSRNVAAGLGFYGLGWSIFTHIVARGREVVLPPDTPVQVRLTGVPFTRAAI